MSSQLPRRFRRAGFGYDEAVRSVTISMVTDQTRSAVWNNILDSERFFRYFGVLADMYSNRHKLVRFGLLGSLIVEATIFIPNISGPVSMIVTVIFGGLIVALAAWDAVSDYGKLSERLKLVSADCGLLRNEWADLWRDIETYTVDEAQARDRLRELETRQSFITSRVEVNLNESINDASEEAAFKVVRDQYAT